MQKRNSVAQQVLWSTVALIVIAMPFHALLTAWFGSNFGFFDVVRLWKEVLLVALFVGISREVVVNKSLCKELKKDPLVIWGSVFLIFTVSMTIFGLVARNVGIEAAAYGAIIDMRFILFMLAVYILAKQTGVPRNWQSFVVGPALIVITFGLLQLTVLPSDFLKHFGYGSSTLQAFQAVDGKPDLVRLQSTLRGPNPLGAYLVPVIVLSAGLARSRKKRKVIWYAATGMTLVIAAATYSRGAWLGIIVAGACLAFWSNSLGRYKKWLWTATASLFIVACGLVIGLRNNDTVQNIVFHSNEFSTATHSSNEDRAHSLRAGLGDIYNRPLGSGIGSAGPASLRNSESPRRISESFFLQIGQEQGIVGLALFSLVLVLIVRKLWAKRSYKLCRTVLASLLGLIVVNLVSHAWADDTLAYVFFGLVGIALAQKGTKSEKSATITA